MNEIEFEAAVERFFDGVRGASDSDELSVRTVQFLKQLFPHYNWVGIYWVRGGRLELGPWKGPAATEHTSIPLGSGICGAAATSGRIENVPDVNRDGRYLQCFLHTKSEIVVPIFSGGNVIGEIDIDSDEVSAFGKRDENFLKRAALLFQSDNANGSEK